MLSFPRPLSAVTGFAVQSSSWAKKHKDVGWDGGNVRKLGAGVDTVKPALIARTPTLDDRSKAHEKAPSLTKHYRLAYPELDSGTMATLRHSILFFVLHFSC